MIQPHLMFLRAKQKYTKKSGLHIIVRALTVYLLFVSCQLVFKLLILI